MLRSSDDRLVSRALQAVRKASGFETATAAAVHFGWPVSRYRSHESGTRNIPEEDLVKYSKAFRVAVKHLADPDPKQIAHQLTELRKAADDARRQVARRLRCARILRGFPSALKAAAAIGVKAPTYLKHENGDNGINDEMAEFYANAFEVSRSWLQTGRFPSRLGEAVDARIRSVLSHPENHLALAEKRVPLSEEAFRVSLRPGRPSTRTMKIPEYRWSELEKNRADVRSSLPHGLVLVPSVAPEETDASIFSVFVDQEHGQLEQYSRVFISTCSHTVEAEYLILVGRQLGVVSLKTGQAAKVKDKIVVGRVIGRLQPLHLESNSQ